MLRLALKLAAAAAALWAIWAFVPLGGRTLSERWSSAPTPGAFVDATWAELRGAGAPAGARPGARARAGRDASRTRPAPPPAERHTEADRQAVDRILSEHLEESARR